MDIASRSTRLHLFFAIFFALLATALFAAGARADRAAPDPAARESWETVRSPEGRFSVQMPGQPRIIPLSRPTIMGPIHGSKHQVPFGESLISVSLMDLPAIATFILPAASILQQAENGIVEELDGKLDETRDLIHQGYPARAFRQEISEPVPRVEDVLLVLVGNRLYIVVASMPPSARDDGMSEGLFESFEVWPE